MQNGVLTLIGGSALLIFSVEALSKTIQYLAGSRFRVWINMFAGNRLAAASLGFILAVLMGSSGAVTVMLVGLANARLLSLHQVLGVTLGAIVGTTVIVQVIAFRISEYASLLIFLGVLMSFLTKEETAKRISQGLIYLGLMFMSMALVRDSSTFLQQNELFRHTIHYFFDRPFVALLLSAAITSFVHSSTATIAFIMSLMEAQNGSVYSAIPWVLGANIGTTSTAFFAGARGGVLGKQVALGHLLVKVVGLIVAYPLIQYLGAFTEYLGGDVSRQIANSHTLFNASLALVFFPFISFGARLVQYFIPEKVENSPFTFQYLDSRCLHTPELALAQAHREILRLSDYVEQMVAKSIAPFRSMNVKQIDSLREKDRLVDFLNKGIKMHLTRLSQSEMTPEQVHKEFELLLRTNDLESIGDIVDKNILGLVKKNQKKGYVFSAEGWKDIQKYHGKVLECVQLSTAYFASSDPGLAVKLALMAEELEELMLELSENHVRRLHEGVKETMDTTSVHLDLLGHLQRIGSLAVNFTHLPDLQSGSS